jgi:hypothetical protein
LTRGETQFTLGRVAGNFNYTTVKVTLAADVHKTARQQQQEAESPAATNFLSAAAAAGI